MKNVRSHIKNLILICLFPITALLINSLIYQIIYIFCPVNEQNEGLYIGIISFVSYILYILIFGYIYIRILKNIPDKSEGSCHWQLPSDTPTTKSTENPHTRSLCLFIASILLTILLGILLQMMVSGILQLINSYYPKLLESYNNMIDHSFTLQNGLLQILTVMFISPVGEELLFRGVMLKLSTYYFHYNIPFSVCFTGILFGLYHGNVIQICYAIPLGILLGCICILSESVLPAITLHMAVNISAYLLPSSLYNTKETTLVTLVISFLFTLLFIYILYKIYTTYTKYLDK